MSFGYGLALPHWQTLSGGFSPAGLFSSGEQGAWYDPSDLTTLFQDSAGTTPVTAVEQPVGLVLDRSKGLALGSELVTNGDFATDTWWSKDAGVTISGGTANWAATAATFQVYRTLLLTVNAYYEVTFTITSISSGGLRANVGGNLGTVRTAPGTYTERLTATGSQTFGIYSSGASTTASVDNVSVKQVAGNHAFQTTSASRPTLRARYNLLTRSEEFNTGWTTGSTTVSPNQTTAPDGTVTADLLYPNSTGTLRWVYQTASGLVSSFFTRSVYAKAQNKSVLYIDPQGSGTAAAYFDLATGIKGSVSAGYTSTIQAVGNGWYRCTITNTTVQTTSFAGVYGVADADGSTTVTANGTDGIYIWGAQLVRTAVFPSNTYQRIAAATDYATAGFPPYLFFDGVDDGLLTNSVNFSATDKMTVWTGVTKSSDAAIQPIVELSAVVDTNNGTMAIGTSIGGTQRWFSALRGTQLAYYEPATYAAPISNVLTTTFDIAGSAISSEIVPRVNGVVEQDNPTGANAGTGNFGNYPLYIGRRNNATIPFNGQIYSLIIRGAQSTAGQISSTETWVAAKTPLGTI